MEEQSGIQAAECRDAQTAHPTPAPAKKRKSKKKSYKNEVQNIQLPAAGDRRFRVECSATKGRHLVADVALAAGSLVLAEPATAFIIDERLTEEYCSCCTQPLAQTRVRASCPWAVYCGDACLQAHAAIRDAEAAVLRHVPDIARRHDVDSALLRMVARLCAVRAAAGADSPAWQNVLALMPHRDAKGADWRAAVRAAAAALAPHLPGAATAAAAAAPQQCPSADELVDLACRVNTNAHGMVDHGGGGGGSGGAHAFGFGLFPLVAMLNHSCAPNCAYTWNASGGGSGGGGSGGGGGGSGRMEVRTIADVAAGEELCVYYIDLLQSTPARRDELLRTKHFLCACARCADPSDADRALAAACCPACGPRGALLPASQASRQQQRSAPDDVDALLAELELTGGDGARKGAKGGKSRSSGGGGSGGGGGGGGSSGGGSGGGSHGGRGDGGGGGGGSGGGNGGGSSGGGGSGGGSNVHANGGVAPAAASGGGVGYAQPNGGAAAGGGAGGPAARDTETQQLHCAACGAAFEAVAVRAVVARAAAEKADCEARSAAASSAAAWKGWLERYDGAAAQGAGGGAAGRAGGGANAKRDQAQPRLHPSHALVVGALVAHANASIAQQDHAAAARALGRVARAMEAVYPPFFPELAGVYEAWAAALRRALAALGGGGGGRGGGGGGGRGAGGGGGELPRRRRDGMAADARYALRRCLEVRRVCLGAAHAATARAAADAAAAGVAGA